MARCAKVLLGLAMLLPVRAEKSWSLELRFDSDNAACIGTNADRFKREVAAELSKNASLPDVTFEAATTCPTTTTSTTKTVTTVTTSTKTTLTATVTTKTATTKTTTDTTVTTTTATTVTKTVTTKTATTVTATTTTVTTTTLSSTTTSFKCGLVVPGCLVSTAVVLGVPDAMDKSKMEGLATVFPDFIEKFFPGVKVTNMKVVATVLPATTTTLMPTSENDTSDGNKTGKPSADGAPATGLCVTALMSILMLADLSRQ